MRTRALAAAAFALATLAAVMPASAFDPETQILGAEVILTGRVVSVRPGETSTEAEIQIDQVWKGAPGAERIRVLTPGGALDNPGFALEGSGRFQPGEKVLVFLTRAGDAYRPFGVVFGKYTIGADDRIAGSLVPPFAEDRSLASASPSLEELRREVSLVVARSGNDGLDVALR